MSPVPRGASSSLLVSIPEPLGRGRSNRKVNLQGEREGGRWAREFTAHFFCLHLQNTQAAAQMLLRTYRNCDGYGIYCTMYGRGYCAIMEHQEALPNTTLCTLDSRVTRIRPCYKELWEVDVEDGKSEKKSNSWFLQEQNEFVCIFYGNRWNLNRIS